MSVYHTQHPGVFMPPLVMLMAELDPRQPLTLGCWVGVALANGLLENV